VLTVRLEDFFKAGEVLFHRRFQPLFGIRGKPDVWDAVQPIERFMQGYPMRNCVVLV
jgi:hypothetical protein